MKSISDSNDMFTKNIMVNKYFLMQMGLKIKNENIKNIKHTKLFGGWNEKEIKDMFNDSFYYDLSDLSISDMNYVIYDKKTIENVLNYILNTMLSLINNKIVINDQLLLLSFQICYNNGDTKSNAMMKKFLDCLTDCVKDCLTYSKHSKLSQSQNTRNYYYFKQFLLFSQIWLCKDLNDKLLFNIIHDLAEQGLIKQKQFIWDSVQNEEKLDSENWNKLCNFTIDGIDNDNQDKLGVLPVYVLTCN